jgi:dihydrofolate reductase
VTAGAQTPKEHKPDIVLIVAMARNRVIGKDGELPWRLSADLKRFRALTMGHPIIMGRKTYDSIGRALPGRRNIVISRNAQLVIEGVETATSLQTALEQVADADQAFVIGGEQIYRMALPLADRIELTLIYQDFEGDALFPQIDMGQWTESFTEAHEDAEAGLRYRFITLDRATRA